MQYYETNDKRGKQIAALAVTLYVALFAVLFLTVRFEMEYNPAEEGFLVDFGDSETGLGVEDVDLADSEFLPESAPSESSEELLTDPSAEETIAVPEAEEEPSKAEEQRAQPTEAEPEPTEQPREVNRRALFPGNTTDSPAQSQGVAEGGGNQGTMSGDKSDQYGAGGDRSGGFDFSLEGRRARGEFPRPAYKEEAQGTVVIRIGVDARGNVISAEYHPAGSTTNNPTLVAEARKAAMGAKFSEKPESDIQFGTITYIFRLR
ncbi:MAG: TonB family protein [Tidjanibacter sp.]|nr:TonB family protein [Tidjanibacter sp.]